MSSDAVLVSPPAAGSARTRVLHRRHALPNGRAVLGAVLLTVAGVGTFAVASSHGDTDTTRYVVVTRAVAPGATLGAGDVTLRPLSLDVDTAAQAFTDTDALTGAVALGPLGPGQLLPRAGVALRSAGGADLAPGHELTITLPASRLPVGLRRGENVAVLATYGSGTDARTVVTVQGARVLGVGEAGESLVERSTARLTLALPDAPVVLETAHAAQVAELTVVRSTFATDALPAVYPEPGTRAGSPAASPAPSTTRAAS